MLTDWISRWTDLQLLLKGRAFVLGKEAAGEGVKFEYGLNKIGFRQNLHHTPPKKKTSTKTNRIGG